MRLGNNGRSLKLGLSLSVILPFFTALPQVLQIGMFKGEMPQTLADYAQLYLSLGDEIAFVSYRGFRTLRATYRQVGELAFRIAREQRMSFASTLAATRCAKSGVAIRSMGTATAPCSMIP